MSGADDELVRIDTPFPLRSSTHVATILAALSKAQASFSELAKSKTATIQLRSGARFSYRYSDLAQVLAAVRPSLTANELTLLQPVAVRAGAVVVTTIIGHSSGEWLSTDLALPAGDATDARALASVSTYARRYSLSALLAIAPAEGEDDDGEATTVQSDALPAPSVIASSDADSRPRNSVAGWITNAQVKRMFGIARANGWTDQQLKTWLIARGVGKSSEIKRAEYDAIVEALRTPPA